MSVYDVSASYLASAATPNTRPRTITTSLFPHGSKLGTKKTLTFKRKEDFTINLDYKQPPAPCVLFFRPWSACSFEICSGFPTRITETELTGVAEAIGNLTERGAIDPVVKATLLLSDSGFVSVTEAHVFGEIKDESLTGSSCLVFWECNYADHALQAN